MNFSDIFKKSFLEGYSATDITSTHVFVCMAITSILAIYIFFVYRIITKKSFYNKNFNISLAAISLITASIILTIQSSVVISLGMVGALSIVRFRTAIKDPMDLMFLFWSISVGIICGAGLAEIAFLTSFILTVGLFVLEYLPVSKAPMLLVVNSDSAEADEKIIETVKKYSKYYKVKSRNLSKRSLEMVIEVRVKEEAQCLKEIMELQYITTASLISHDGEVTF